MLYEVDREQIWTALFDLLQGAMADLVVTKGRYHRRPPNLIEAEQPAMFLLQVREKRDPRLPGTPGKMTLEGMIVLYCQAPSPQLSDIGQETGLGATVLNQLLKAIDGAFEPDAMTGKLTLGGLVEHCWIEGNTDMDPGIVSAQAAAIVPVKILVP